MTIHYLYRNNSILEKEIKEREEYLKENPFMKNKQDYIIEELRKAGKTQKERLEVIHRLMAENSKVIEVQVSKLKTAIEILNEVRI